MKKFTLIPTLVLLLTVSALNAGGQTPADYDTILKTSLQVTEMIAGNHTDSSGKTILAIADNGKVSKSTRLTWFGSTILFASIAEIKGRGFSAWVEFTEMKITSETAAVTLLYIMEGSATKKVELKFTRSDSVWLILASNITFI